MILSFTLAIILFFYNYAFKIKYFRVSFVNTYIKKAFKEVFMTFLGLQKLGSEKFSPVISRDSIMDIGISNRSISIKYLWEDTN